MQNHGYDVYNIRKKQDSVSTHLKPHTRQTTTEGEYCEGKALIIIGHDSWM